MVEDLEKKIGKASWRRAGYLPNRYLHISLLAGGLTLGIACASESGVVNAPFNQNGLDANGEVYSSEEDLPGKKDTKEERQKEISPETVQECPHLYFEDKDGDNYGTPQVWVCKSLAGFVKDNSDCDDNNPAVHQTINCQYNGDSCGEVPLCLEKCLTPPEESCDGIDNNCDGKIDEDGVCVFCDEYTNYYYLIPGKCCTKGEQGGMLCITDFFYSFVHKLTGLTWDGQYLWVASDVYDNNKIYQLTTAGEIINSFDSPNKYPQGLAWDGQHLWNANDYTNKIYQLTTTGTVVSSFDSFGEYPTGLTWDGKFLWNADQEYNKIYKLAATGKVLASFDSPASDPTGLAWDDQYLWVSSHGWIASEYYGKIYKITTSGQIINSFYSPNKYPQGLAWDGQYLWHADSTSGEDKIYKLQIIEE